MPDLINERPIKLFHPETAGAVVGDIWTYDTRSLGGQWKTPLTPVVSLPLSVANGGTGTNNLPLPVNTPPVLSGGALVVGHGTSPVTTSETWGMLPLPEGSGILNGQAASATLVPSIWLSRSLGTPGAPAAVTNGTVLGQFHCRGYGTDWTAATQINSVAAENWSGTANGSYLQFWTVTPTTTTTVMSMRVGPGVQIGAPTGGDKGVGTLNATAVYANNVLLTSDIRLKEDIGRVPEGCLGLVSAIAPKTFKHRGSGEGAKRNWGFIAQEVNAVMVVNKHYDFGGHIEDAAGNQYLSPTDLIACLWQAVRELREEVKALSKEQVPVVRG